MEIHKKSAVNPQRLGILAGTFHPPTIAHLALAKAALDHVDEVLFVLPRQFPHKDYSGVGFDQRLEMLLRATEDQPHFSVGSSNGGLFLEIARECRPHYGEAVELWFVCGQDAAIRVLTWRYDDPSTVHRMLEEFGLLVADRGGSYEPPAEYAHRIRKLHLPSDYSDVSATAVRERISRGEPWHHLVPASILELVELYYRPTHRNPAATN